MDGARHRALLHVLGLHRLALTIIEAYGDLFSQNFAIPFIGHGRCSASSRTCSPSAVLLGIIGFAIIRLRNNPKREGRDSRFYGSHTGAAWVVLRHDLPGHRHAAALPRRAVQHRPLPLRPRRVRVADRRPWLAPLGTGVNSVLETMFMLAQMAVIFGFLRVRHLLQAPAHRPGPDERAVQPPPERARRAAADADATARCSTSRRPTRTPTSSAAARSRTSPGRAASTSRTCTECGRCQSQCPAWNTGKPLSPKLLIMDLRDHALRQGAPTCSASQRRQERRRPCPTHIKDEAQRPLVGDPAAGGVIDPDVLWSCTTCGACVEQCPVDIEHIDHIVDMRRYQVLIESAFPSEAGVMLRNLENKGNPWGMGQAGGRSGSRTGLRGAGRRREDSTPTSSTCSGSAAPVRWRTVPARPPGDRRRCCTRRA